MFFILLESSWNINAFSIWGHELKILEGGEGNSPLSSKKKQFSLLFSNSPGN